MHEMGIANSILDAADKEAVRNGGGRVLRIGVRIGEWSGVEPESLRFCFDCLVADVAPSAPRLEIEFCPRKNQCPRCGAQFPVIDFNVVCPVCQSSETKAAGGDELELSFVELEEALV